MIMIIFLLININNSIFILISNILIWGSVFLTVYSLLEYIFKNIEILKE